MNSLVGLKLLYNDEKLVRIKNNSYFFHRIPAGVHKYSSKAWGNKYDGLELTTEAGEIYFVQIDQTSSTFMSSNLGGANISSGDVNFEIYPRTKSVGKILWDNIEREVK